MIGRDMQGDRVLVLAPIGRDGATAAAFLAEAGFETTVCHDLAGLVRELETGAAVAVVAAEAFPGGSADALKAWVEGQEPWSDFPFILLSPQGPSAAAQASILNLMQALRNVALLERPVSVVTLVSAVRSALRARRRQYEARDYMWERERTAIKLEAMVADRTRELEQANEKLREEMQEREQVEATLRHVQKLEAIGQITGGVAHDFNNLLTAVIGNLDLALRRIEDPKAQRMLVSAQQAAERGARLTSHLLAFARKQRLKAEPVDINAMLRGMEELLLRTIGPAVQIELKLDGELWSALVDLTQLELVILNLAINARDAMPEGGHLIIATKNVEAGGLQPQISPGDYVRISVIDTGMGMPENVRARAFEPFFTTKPLGQGTGLGLSQVYGVAKQSGGDVRIDSEVGRGTTVSIFLPRAPALSQTASPVQQQPAPAQHRPAAILVVDDDPDVRELAGSCLETLGYTPLLAANGRAALDLLESTSSVDLMLVDYAMPGLTGLEVARQAEMRKPGITVLMMTGFADPTALAELNGHTAVLRKPFSLSELGKQVADALAARSSQRAGPRL